MFENPMLDPFSQAAFSMTVAQNPEVAAQMMARLGIPPPMAGQMPGQMPMPGMLPGMQMGGGDIGAAMAGPMPGQGGMNNAVVPTADEVPPQGGQGSDTVPAPPPAAAGGKPPGTNEATGLAALGRGLLASKAGTTDPRPQFSGGITQAAKPETAAPRVYAGQQAALAQALAQLLPKGAGAPIPTLGGLLGGRGYGI